MKSYPKIGTYLGLWDQLICYCLILFLGLLKEQSLYTLPTKYCQIETKKKYPVQVCVLHHVMQDMPEEYLCKIRRGHCADIEFKQKEKRCCSVLYVYCVAD